MQNTLNNQKDYSLVSNSFGFLRLDLNFNPYSSISDWVITGVPFDTATSGRSGSRFAPNAIRQISTNLAWEDHRWPWNFNLHDYLKIIDCGDLVYIFGNGKDLSDKLQLHAEKLLINKKQMLTFGGDHYITLPLLRAHYKIFGPMSILHFDAHTDTYVNNSIFDHGSVFYHAVNEQLIDPKCSIQIGIRTEYSNSLKFNIIDAAEFNDNKIEDILFKIKNVVGCLPTYLTFDIDCLDPSCAPGTGTPVIGGLTTDKISKIIRNLYEINIIGMDIVEVLPSYDTANITSLTAASIALDLLYVQAFKKRDLLNKQSILNN